MTFPLPDDAEATEFFILSLDAPLPKNGFSTACRAPPSESMLALALPLVLVGVGDGARALPSFGLRSSSSALPRETDPAIGPEGRGDGERPHCVSPLLG